MGEEECGDDGTRIKKETRPPFPRFARLVSGRSVCICFFALNDESRVGVEQGIIPSLTLLFIFSSLLLVSFHRHRIPYDT